MTMIRNVRFIDLLTVQKLDGLEWKTRLYYHESSSFSTSALPQSQNATDRAVGGLFKAHVQKAIISGWEQHALTCVVFPATTSLNALSDFDSVSHESPIRQQIPPT